MQTQPPRDESFDERIARESLLLDELGYRYRIKKEAEKYYVVVDTQRETEIGPQPVTIYLTLNRQRFPAIAPELTVTATAMKIGPDGELVEVPLELDSKARYIWDQNSSLSEIVADIYETVQNPYLWMKLLPRVTEPLSIQGLPEDGLQPTSPPPLKEHLHNLPPATPPISETKAIPTPGLIDDGDKYKGASEPVAQPSVQEPGPVSLPRLSKRQFGMLSAIAALGLGFVLVIRLLPFAPVLGQTDSEATATAINGRVQEIWKQVDLRHPSTTSESLTQDIIDLTEIRKLEPDSMHPSRHISATLLLVQNRISLGDTYYPNDLAAAALQYQEAGKLMDAYPAVRDRLNWIERHHDLQAADMTKWPNLLARLELAARQPTLRDPAGKSIVEWLYNAHIRYGSQIMQRGAAAYETQLRRSDADAAHEQAMAALALAGQVADRGAQARELQKQAEQLRESAGNYRVQMTRPDPDMWKQLLQERVMWLTPTLDLQSQPQEAALPNLIILLPSSSIAVMLLDAAGNEQTLLAKHFGVISAALSTGRYRLSIDEGGISQEIVLDFSANGPPYLVKIIPR